MHRDNMKSKPIYRSSNLVNRKFSSETPKKRITILNDKKLRDESFCYPYLAVEETSNFKRLLGHSHFDYVEPLPV